MDLAIENFLYRFSNYSSWFLYIRACVFVSLQGEHASFLFIFSSSVPDIDDVSQCPQSLSLHHVFTKPSPFG